MLGCAWSWFPFRPLVVDTLWVLLWSLHLLLYWKSLKLDRVGMNVSPISTIIMDFFRDFRGPRAKGFGYYF